jgi:hypothetical protein
METGTMAASAMESRQARGPTFGTTGPSTRDSSRTDFAMGMASGTTVPKGTKGTTSTIRGTETDSTSGREAAFIKASFRMTSGMASEKCIGTKTPTMLEIGKKGVRKDKGKFGNMGI